MHKGYKGYLGLLMIASGVIIVMSLVLPGKFWWFVLAASLIISGLWCVKCS